MASSKSETFTVLQTSVAAARKQKAVVEYRDVGGPEWWVMLPNGSVQVCDTASAALKEVQKAAKRGNRGITITTIEWRDTPEGFAPPKGDER